MDFFDLTSDGNKELIVGFDDGTIHVYAIDPENYQTTSPRLIYSHVSQPDIDRKLLNLPHIFNFEQYLNIF